MENSGHGAAPFEQAQYHPTHSESGPVFEACAPTTLCTLLEPVYLNRGKRIDFAKTYSAVDTQNEAALGGNCWFIFIIIMVIIRIIMTIANIIMLARSQFGSRFGLQLHRHIYLLYLRFLNPRWRVWWA